jgi:ferritin-like protein
MSEMVERVAQAIFASAEEVFKWEHLVPEAHDRYRRHARAAIEAIRDYLNGDLPPALDDAYENAMPYADHPSERYFSPTRFSALIQAALKEPT